jgi:hypothetical protein
MHQLKCLHQLYVLLESNSYCSDLTFLVMRSLSHACGFVLVLIVYFDITIQCVSSIHYQHSWRIDTEDGPLVSGGNNWLQRQFTKSEPHEITLGDDGVISLTRLRDSKVIDSIKVIRNQQ